MSIRISFDNPPEFYTNLDVVSGRVLLHLGRTEQIGAVVVKLEGESRTALAVPPPGDPRAGRTAARAGPGGVATENHKLLYRVQQVLNTEVRSPGGGGPSMMLSPGPHEFRFSFKMPLNNICHDPHAMSTHVGVGTGAGTDEAGTLKGGPNSPPGFLGLGGFRTMDGSRQLLLQHVKATLPPSLTGFPQEAEIRYYIKVTIQRPGLFRENWRYQVGFKFLPLEPPRPPRSQQEAFARRPFVFKPRPPMPSKKGSIFNRSSHHAQPSPADQNPPSIEVAARLPHPAILTCHEPLPLRLLARRLKSVDACVRLISLEIALVGYTQVRVEDLANTEVTRWVVGSWPSLQIELECVGDKEFEVPSYLWAERRLPNTVAPSFRTCNLARRYELELRIGLSWDAPDSKGSNSKALPQLLHLPLTLSKVQVYSGIRPPPELLSSVDHTGPTRPPQPPRRPPLFNGGTGAGAQSAPVIPQSTSRPVGNLHHHGDPLYPPQLAEGSRPHEDAPPSYDEAMADSVSGPPTSARPAFSGVTNENAPSDVPAGEKS